MIQVTDSANNILVDPSQGPYDGSDDTLIGFLNSSSDTISGIQLSSNTDLFGFDGDGLCTESNAPAGCPFGTTGYEGPGTSFTGITPDESGGVVDFSPGIAPGQSAYFSLEEALTGTTVTVGGPSLAEQGGPVNLSENRTTCSVAKPVNCASGVFWHQFDDLSIPGRGVPLNFSRTYSSSQAAVNGPLGFGWTDSYNMSLATDASGDVTITQEDGSTVTFAPDGSGGFVAPPRVLASLAENADGSFTFIRDKSQTQYNFSATGQLTSEVDLNGYQTQLTYNGSGQLTTVTDPAGRTLTFTYSGTHIIKVTDPMGRSWSYTYDASGNLATATDPLNRTWSFSYDPNHLLLKMTDPRGGITTNVYNSSAQVTSQTDPDGNVTTWSYSGDPTSTAGGTTTMTDPNGNVTTYQFANLELTSVTHAAGTALAATTSYSYDPATLGVTSVTDPKGNTTTSSYDLSGNLLSSTDPLGNTTSYDYNSFDEVLSKTSPLDETTSYDYDGSGNLLDTTDPLGNFTSYSYGDAAHPGDVTSVTDPDGDVTTFSYDSDGDLASSSVKPGAKLTDTTAYVYDADGERTCQASANATAAHVTCPAAGGSPVANTTATAYSADGEVTSVTDPNGHTSSYTYDADGNQIQETDANGNVTGYTFNGDNQQTKITRPDGTTLPSGFDADGNLISQTDGAGHVTKHTYNALNQMISTTDPLGRTTTFGYDGAGNRTSLTDPAGRVTTYSYDTGSELTGISYSDGKTPDVSYSYDPDGQRSTMTDGTGTTSYSFDSDGHLASVTNGAGGTVSYGYDPAGRLTTVTYPNGNSVNRAYNSAGRLFSVTDWLGDKTNFSYDADGNITTETYPNGVTATSTFDHDDQVASITDKKGSTTLASFGYGRDNLGQVTSDTDTGAFSQATTYSYNQINQLASVNKNAFSYDAAGNPVTLSTGNAQSFDPADELTSVHRPTAAKAPATDQMISANETTKATKVVSPVFTTKTPDELLLAFVSATGPSTGGQKVTAMSGGGLTWSLVGRSDAKAGTAEVWQAHVPGLLANVKVTATLADAADGSITVASFTGARAVAGAHATANGTSTSPAVSLTTTGADSLVWGVGDDPTSAFKRTPTSGQTLVNQELDSGSHATYWSQKTGTIKASGTKVTLGDTTTAKDSWNLVAVEVVSAAGTSATYSYDSDGNRTKVTPSSGSATTLGYDQANRLISDGSTTFGYDGDGLRMSKTVNGTTTAFAWDQSATLPLVLAAGGTSYIYGPDNQPIEQINATGTATYLLADQQGSTRLLTDPTGTVVGTYNFNPYGLPIAHTGTASTALLYDGQYTDDETGLIYLQTRYYDPATAEFLSVDPAELLTNEAYAYTEDDPVNGSDPSGMICFSFHCVTHDALTTVAKVTGTIHDVETDVALAGAVVGVAEIAAAPFTDGATLPLGLLTLAASAELAEAAEPWGDISLLATCLASNWSEACQNGIELTIETGNIYQALPKALAEKLGEYLLDSQSDEPRTPSKLNC